MSTQAPAQDHTELQSATEEAPNWDEELNFDKAVDDALTRKEIADEVDVTISRDSLHSRLSGLQREIFDATAVERQRWILDIRSVNTLSKSRPPGKKLGHTWLIYLSWTFFAFTILTAILGIILAIGIGTAGELTIFVIPVVCALAAILLRHADRRTAHKRAIAKLERAATDVRQVYYNAVVDQITSAARDEINQSIPGHEFDLTLGADDDSPGLAGIYSDRNRVQRRYDNDLEGLFRLPSITVGVAGPRGAGKTSLIRKYCPSETYVSPDGSSMALLVSAPVEYEPREFVLYLLATLCSTYMEYRQVRGEEPARQNRIMGLLPARIENAENAEDSDLYDLADQRLQEVRYLQTFTTAASVNVSTSGGILGFSRNSESSLAEVPLSYPKIVSNLRSFLEQAAKEVHRNNGRVYIGIDEIDKISDARQAQRFINEMKVVLGVENCYYLITLSDDALASYELRGLPIRDAFDSAFDEIIRVGYMRLKDSRALMSKRVIGMSEPFVCLCHCLSGGLPRDLIRTARHAVTAAAQGPHESSDHIAAVCERLVADDLAGKLHAVGVKLANTHTRAAVSEFLHDVQNVADGHPSDLRQGLASLCRRGEALDEVVDGTPGAGELSAHLWFLLTVIEMFNEDLSEERVEAGKEETAGECVFDRLCRARQELSTDPGRARLTVTAVRRAWQLSALRPGTGPGRRGWTARWLRSGGGRWAGGY